MKHFKEQQHLLSTWFICFSNNASKLNDDERWLWAVFNKNTSLFTPGFHPYALMAFGNGEIKIAKNLFTLAWDAFSFLNKTVHMNNEDGNTFCWIFFMYRTLKPRDEAAVTVDCVFQVSRSFYVLLVIGMGPDCCVIITLIKTTTISQYYGIAIKTLKNTKYLLIKKRLFNWT